MFGGGGQQGWKGGGVCERFYLKVTVYSLQEDFYIFP